MTTCPGYVIDEAGRMDACPACYRGIDHMAENYRSYLCTVCGTFGRRTVPGSCCGKPRVLRMEVPIPCRKCGQLFKRTMGKTVDCPACTGRQTLESRRKREKLKPPKAPLSAPPTSAIPCARCIHAACNAAAESGWECRLQVAGRCAPWGPARFFKEQE